MFEILYVVSAVIVLLSILLFSCCVSSVKNFGLRFAIWVGLELAWFLAHLLLFYFNCQLPEYWRDKSRTDLQCAHADVMEYSLAVVEIISVVFLMLIPVSWLANLHISPKRKKPLFAACALHTCM